MKNPKIGSNHLTLSNEPAFSYQNFPSVFWAKTPGTFSSSQAAQIDQKNPILFFRQREPHEHPENMQ